MEETLRTYYELKQQQKELEQALDELREEIIAWCAQHEGEERLAGGYGARIVQQDRRVYDDSRLYEALPEASVWRLVSKADPAKVASLVKLNMISEEALRGTYTTKRIQSLQVRRI
ncbi:hypothetical protein [Paenibacillus xylaniclasticus]|uniref:hypothetical protein n=1 Tax=Paenibacillus xylaniclasticus TaxID=588083 RepID=UPI000FD72FB1|nr:hypothetical protein [Paenibacillus xylaniclasticus]